MDNIDKAKKVYNKMKSDGILPDHFHGSWEKDKTRFTKQIFLDENIGISYEEVDGLGMLDDNED